MSNKVVDNLNQSIIFNWMATSIRNWNYGCCLFYFNYQDELLFAFSEIIIYNKLYKSYKSYFFRKEEIIVKTPKGKYAWTATLGE